MTQPWRLNRSSTLLLTRVGIKVGSCLRFLRKKLGSEWLLLVQAQRDSPVPNNWREPVMMLSCLKRMIALGAYFGMGYQISRWRKLILIVVCYRWNKKAWSLGRAYASALLGNLLLG